MTHWYLQTFLHIYFYTNFCDVTTYFRILCSDVVIFHIQFPLESSYYSYRTGSMWHQRSVHASLRLRNNPYIATIYIQYL